MSKTATFETIFEHFDTSDKEVMMSGHMPMRSTAKGFWGVSNMKDVHAFFEKMNFPKDTRFIDLGCGDGRAAMIAALFVQAEGVEYDEELAQNAQRVAQELGSTASIMQGDMLDIDLTQHDIIFMYADQRFDFLKEKLLKELNGTLYLYHDTYHPDYLKKGKITWIGQIPIFSYTNPRETSGQE